jgi:hypothetical protein
LLLTIIVFKPLPIDPETARPPEQQQQLFSELEKGFMTAIQQRGGVMGLGFNG